MFSRPISYLQVVQSHNLYCSFFINLCYQYLILMSFFFIINFSTLLHFSSLFFREIILVASVPNHHSFSLEWCWWLLVFEQCKGLSKMWFIFRIDCLKAAVVKLVILLVCVWSSLFYVSINIEWMSHVLKKLGTCPPFDLMVIPLGNSHISSLRYPNFFCIINN